VSINHAEAKQLLVNNAENVLLEDFGFFNQITLMEDERNRIRHLLSGNIAT